MAMVLRLLKHFYRGLFTQSIDNPLNLQEELTQHTEHQWQEDHDHALATDTLSISKQRWPFGGRSMICRGLVFERIQSEVYTETLLQPRKVKSPILPVRQQQFERLEAIAVHEHSSRRRLSWNVQVSSTRYHSWNVPSY